MTIATRQQPTSMKYPPTLRELSSEFQPIEFADVVYNDSADMYGGWPLFAQLTSAVCLWNALMMIGGVMILLALEDAKAFHTVGYVLGVFGVLSLTVTIAIEFYRTEQSMKRPIGKR